jgi:GDP-L-fucose synthase
MEGNWNAIRRDIDARPIEQVSGSSTVEEITAILNKYGISEKSLILWGTGTPMREFLWSEEMADACVFILEHVDFADLTNNKKEVRNCHINIGSGEEISIRDLAYLVKECVDYRGLIEFDSSKPDGTMRKLTDVSKLNALGWKHSIRVNDGVKMLYEWYLNNL